MRARDVREVDNVSVREGVITQGERGDTQANRNQREARTRMERAMIRKEETHTQTHLIIHSFIHSFI